MVQADALNVQPFVHIPHPDIKVGQMLSERRIHANVSTLVVSRGLKNNPLGMYIQLHVYFKRVNSVTCCSASVVG